MPHWTDPALVTEFTAQVSAVRPAALSSARADAVALTTAADGMPLAALGIIQDWVGPQGRALPRTAVLAEELLTLAAQMVAYPFTSRRLSVANFPDLRVPVRTPMGQLQNLAALLVSHTVRGEVAPVRAVLAQNLSSSSTPRQVRRFLQALATVTATCAAKKAASTGQTVHQVLTEAGLAAAR